MRVTGGRVEVSVGSATSGPGQGYILIRNSDRQSSNIGDLHRYQHNILQEVRSGIKGFSGGPQPTVGSVLSGPGQGYILIRNSDLGFGSGFRFGFSIGFRLSAWVGFAFWDWVPD